MKVKNLTQRTPTGYTFQLAFGPFWVTNWWYNTESKNVVPPSQYTKGKRYGYVVGYGLHFARVRKIVGRMVELGWTAYDSDDMLLPEYREHFVESDEESPVTDGDDTYITEWSADEQ